MASQWELKDAGVVRLLSSGSLKNLMRNSSVVIFRI